MSDKVPAMELKMIKWPKCSRSCAFVELMGVGECESACPEKFNNEMDIITIDEFEKSL